MHMWLVLCVRESALCVCERGTAQRVCVFVCVVCICVRVRVLVCVCVCSVCVCVPPRIAAGAGAL